MLAVWLSIWTLRHCLTQATGRAGETTRMRSIREWRESVCFTGGPPNIVRIDAGWQQQYQPTSGGFHLVFLKPTAAAEALLGLLAAARDEQLPVREAVNLC